MVLKKFIAVMTIVITAVVIIPNVSGLAKDYITETAIIENNCQNVVINNSCKSRNSDGYNEPGYTGISDDLSMIDVAGKAVESSDNGERRIYELGTDAINYTNLYTDCMQIPSEKWNGIYFINGQNLSFYSFEARTTEQIYEFKNSRCIYQNEDRIYSENYEKCCVEIYNLNTRAIEKEVSLPFNGEEIGVDDDGRIYMSSYNSDGGYTLSLLSAEGEILSQTEVENKVYRFSGFDPINGNFYYEGYMDWVYWGFDHDMHVLYAGNVTDNIIIANEKYLDLLCQNYYYEHQNSAILDDGRYLIAQSITNGYFWVMDSNSFLLLLWSLPQPPTRGCTVHILLLSAAFQMPSAPYNPDPEE